EAVVVAVVVLRVDVEGRERDPARGQRLHLAAFLLAGPAAPPEPDPAVLAQRAEEADREPAGRLAAFRRGDAVGDGDQSRHRASSHARLKRIAAVMIPTRL